MNAYELAKAQQAYSPPTLEEIIKQQADRIAELEKDLALKTRDRDVFCDFTLAYEKRIAELEKLEQDFIRVIKQTNPNKLHKELSNEEIKKIWRATPTNEYNSQEQRVCDFARAIIKASRGEE